MDKRGTWGALILGALVACGGGAGGPESGGPPTSDAGDAGDASDAPIDGAPDGPCKPPEALDFTIDVDNSSYQSGSSALAVNATFARAATFAVEVESCDADCSSNCTFHGPVATQRGTLLHRCSTDPAAKCTEDTDCGVGTCEFYATAPVAGDLFGTLEICDITRFARLDGADPWAIRGTIDLATGSLHIERMRFETLVAASRCPTCEGDLTYYDGQSDGHCAGTELASQCDVHGFTGFLTGSEGPTSLDCIVNGLDYDPELTKTVDLVGLSNDDVTRTLTSDSPDCGDGNGKCWCGACSGDAEKPCFNSTDCDEGQTCGTVATMVYDGCFRDDAGDTECDFDAGLCDFRYDEDIRVSCGTTDGVPTDTFTLEGVSQVSPEKIHVVASRFGCTPSTGSVLFDRYYGFPGISYSHIAFDIRPASLATP